MLRMFSLFMLVLLICTSEASQSTKCNYLSTSDSYICYLSLISIQESANSSINYEGHILNKTNDDVNAVIGLDVGNLMSVACENLTQLVLCHGEIETVDENDLESCKNLEKLNLDKNRIENLPQKFFNGLIKLRKVNLSKNQIVELPPTIFAPLINLEELILSHNKLKTIHSDSFGSHPKLKVITLSENNLESFDKRIIDNNAAIQTIWSYNGGNCITSNNYETDGRSKIHNLLKECYENYHERESESRSEIQVPHEINVLFGKVDECSNLLKIFAEKFKIELKKLKDENDELRAKLRERN